MLRFRASHTCLFAFLLAVTVTAQDNGRPAEKKLDWGPKQQGLRMAVWIPKGSTKVFGLVRNFSAKTVCYCQPPLSNLTIFVRTSRSAEWQVLQPAKPPEPAVIVSDCPVRVLRPREDMADFMLEDGVRKRTNYSFELDLSKYRFPEKRQGSVEAWVMQSNVYCGGDKTLDEVESSPFEISLPLP